MLFWMREPRDRNAFQLARADFIVDALRQNLAAGSLWHEKRFALGQLESLVIASTGGMYYINTFDPSDPRLAHRHAMTVFGNLGIEVAHEVVTHETLTQADVERITTAANCDFEDMVSKSGDAVISGFRRVTCNIEFASPDDDTERYAAFLFDEIAQAMGYPLTFRPFVFGEIFLPSVDPTWPAVTQCRDFARSAAEFVFENPLPVNAVTERFQSLVNGDGSLSELVLTAGNAGRRGIKCLECVGRYF